MSGILALAKRHTRPLNPAILKQMMAALIRRGPDGQATWCDGRVCLGHTLFRTIEDVTTQGLASLANSGLWITADARIDAQEELRRELAACGQQAPIHTPDATLILHAYQAWGEDCVGHLLGDFAFIIWDQRRSVLFAARDHFGIKPLYYTQIDDVFLASSRVAVLRRYPGVSDALDEDAVADFLLFRSYQDPSRTIYAAIRALPPAHTLTWRVDEAKPQKRRYWTLPTDGTIRYKTQNDYIQHFRQILGQAVQDRLRSQRVNVLMSGGLDSTAVAALARETGQASLRAFTLDSTQFSRKEREIFPAREVARHLGLPIEVINVDGYTLFQGWDQPNWVADQPQADPLWQLSVDLYRRMAGHSRVVLTGQGGDPALYPSRHYLLNQVKKLHWRSLAAALREYHRGTGEWPPFYLRTRLTRGGRSSPRQISPPAFDFWFQPDFVKRQHLPDRWQRWKASIECVADAPHPLRPEAYTNLSAHSWVSRFTQTYNIETGGTAVEFRHPYFDIRVIEYLLALPPLPWFEAKFIVRQALRGRIPESVRNRPKNAIISSFIHTLTKQQKFDIDVIEKVIWRSQTTLEQYINFANLLKAVKLVHQLNQDEFEQLIAELGLIFWDHYFDGTVWRHDENQSQPRA